MYTLGRPVFILSEYATDSDLIALQKKCKNSAKGEEQTKIFILQILKFVDPTLDCFIFIKDVGRSLKSTQ